MQLNGAANIRIRQGTIDALDWPEPFDIILANINKNILLKEMGSYASHLVANGLLQLSGFYATDITDLVHEASKHDLHPHSQDDREQWATLRLIKTGVK